MSRKPRRYDPWTFLAGIALGAGALYLIAAIHGVTWQ